uniref:Uncharacterized protein n=1 Tax=Romanomermis culicivorax TaxID=13658 RepID=A0A915HNB2_ROMCU
MPKAKMTSVDSGRILPATDKVGSNPEQFYSHQTCPAGPPFEPLNFRPKSPRGPPGLCDAVIIKPPSVLCFRIRHETAGVDRKPF